MKLIAWIDSPLDSQLILSACRAQAVLASRKQWWSEACEMCSQAASARTEGSKECTAIALCEKAVEKIKATEEAMLATY